MSRPSKGARLVWRDESFKRDGTLRNSAGWFIRDGQTFISACGGTGDRRAAEIRIAAYIAEKYQPARERGRGLADIQIADVINVYLTDVVPGHAKPKETAGRLVPVLNFFGDRTLADINGQLCRDYAASHGNGAAARLALEYLRAAVLYHHSEGYAPSAPKIVLPAKPQPRETWLTRSEAARLLWALWRMRQTWKGQPSDRRTGRHVARFVLVGLYTGTRSGAICGAAIRPTPGHGHVDLDRGVFFRQPAGKKQTNKRQPPVRLPDRLLVHMRRWARIDLEIKTKGRGKSRNIGRRISQDFVVEWNGKPVVSVKKAFRQGRVVAGLPDTVTPHILRHTAATWLMLAGTDPWKAAGFLGMSVEVLIQTYGHHHPDFQADAAEAITSKAIARYSPANVVRLGEKQSANAATSPHKIPTATSETTVNKRRRS